MIHRYYLLLLICCAGTPGLGSDTVGVGKQLEQAAALMEARNWIQAEAMAGEGLKRLPAIADAYPELSAAWINILGDCAMGRGDFHAAGKYYEKALSLVQEKNTYLLCKAETLHKIGNYYRELKDYEKSLEFLNQSLSIRLQHLGERHIKLADSYNNMGDCLNFIGDYDKGLSYHDQALSIRLEKFHERHPLVAQSYNNIGISFQGKNEYQLALSNYEKALAIYKVVYDENREEVADVYINLGTVHEALGRLDLHVMYHERALAIYRKILPTFHPSIALCYNNIAGAYAQQGNYSEAAKLFQKALGIRLNIYGTQHPDIAATYFNLGNNYALEEKWTQATEAYRESLEALNYTPGRQQDFHLVNDPILLLQVLATIAVIPQIKYADSSQPYHLEEALALYRQADLLIDFLRTRYEAVGSKLHLADKAHEIYNAAIEIAIELHKVTDQDSFLHRAFQFSEKSKGVIMLEALKKSDAQQFSGVPEGKIAELNGLELRIGDLEKQRYLEWSRQTPEQMEVIDSLDNLLFRHKQLLSNTIRQLEHNHPSYFHLRYQTTTLPVEWVQHKLLDRDQCIIEYFLGSRYLFIFVIGKKQFQVVDIQLTPGFVQSLNTFLLSIRRFRYAATEELQENTRQYAEAAFRLYQYLIEPVLPFLGKQLIVIPDAELGLLPFDAMLTAQPDLNGSFVGFPYLVKKYCVSYNYSIQLLHEMLEHKTTKKLQFYLGMAPVFQSGNGKNLSPLKYNKQEIIEVHQVMGGKSLIHESATKNAFLQLQSAYKIIHLATHGQADNSSSDFSFLAFSENAAENKDSALLFVKEIYNLTCRADMVVLSACETGTGELQRGEGITSIARSFSYAGAKSLIATQWSIDDKAAGQLMFSFFNSIKKGIPKDLALQQAKLDLINTSRAAHPFFWAAFVAIGDMAPIETKNSLFFYLWSLLLLPFGYLGYCWLKLRKMEHRLFKGEG